MRAVPTLTFTNVSYTNTTNFRSATTSADAAVMVADAVAAGQVQYGGTVAASAEL
jgi:hypothetical protein